MWEPGAGGLDCRGQVAAWWVGGGPDGGGGGGGGADVGAWGRGPGCRGLVVGGGPGGGGWGPGDEATVFVSS